MKLILVSTLLLILSATSFAEETISLLGISSNTGPTQRIKITKEDFLKTPTWDRKSTLPVSLDDALMLAVEHIENELTKTGVFVTEARLKSKLIGVDEKPERRWYYKIVFIDPDDTKASSDIHAIVMMDGTVLLPEVEDEK